MHAPCGAAANLLPPPLRQLHQWTAVALRPLFTNVELMQENCLRVYYCHCRNITRVCS